MKSISWEALREANFVVCVICVGLTIFSGATWLGVLDGIIAGATGGAVLYITMIIRMKYHVDNMVRAMEAMAELNRQLIEGKVEMVLELDGDHDPRAARSLH